MGGQERHQVLQGGLSMYQTADCLLNPSPKRQLSNDSLATLTRNSRPVRALDFSTHPKHKSKNVRNGLNTAVTLAANVSMSNNLAYYLL